MPKKITGLTVNRIALVDAGANPGADLVLFKRKEPTSVLKVEFNEIVDARKFRQVVDELCYMTYDLESAIASALWSEGDRAGEIAKSVRQFSEAVETALASWLDGTPVGKQKLVQKLSDSIKALIQKRVASLIKEDEGMPIDITKMTAKERAELKKQLDAADAPQPDPTPVSDEVLKSLPDEVRKALETAQQIAKDASDRVTAAEKKAVELEKTVQTEREKREHTERLQKAQDRWPFLPGTAEEKALLLKGAEADETLMKTLDQSNASFKLTMTTIGAAGAESDAEDDPIEKRAKELMADGKMSRAKAIAKAAEENPEAYRESLKDKDRRIAH